MTIESTPSTTETPSVIETPATETPTPEQVQEEEKAFAEGFTEARGDEPPAPPSEKDSASEPETTPETETKPETTPEAPAAKTADDPGKTVKELLDKMQALENDNRRLHGRYGELQSLLQKASKPGQTVKFKKDALKRISKEYPEIAEMLSEDLSEAIVFESAEPTTPAKADVAAPSQDDIEARINQGVEQRVEARLLAFKHKDWKILSREKEFDEFLKTLPGKVVQVPMADGSILNYPEEAKKYIESNSADVTSECFDKYKEWKSARQKSKTTNKERLEGALTPKGGGAVPEATLDDEAAFNAGFKSARGIA